MSRQVVTEQQAAQIVIMAPALARQWLNERLYDQKLIPARTVRQGDVRKYARQIRSGKFQGHSVLKVGVLDGKYYLLNGQHRLLGVELAGRPQVFQVVYVHCNTEAELIAAYQVEDDHVPRNPGDRITQALLDETKLATKTDAKILIRAVIFMRNGLRTDGTTTGYTSGYDIEEAIVREWAPEMRRYQALLREHQDKNIGPTKFFAVPVLSVFLVLLRYAGNVGEMFIRSAIGADPVRRSPTDWCHQLIEVATNHPSLPRTVSDGGPKQAAIARQMAYTWNKYRQGKGELKKLLPSSGLAEQSATGNKLKPKIIIIAGTPFDGTSHRPQTILDAPRIEEVE